MGGRLDATNVVDPLISVITDISLDHTEWLGSTIAAITREKAGILRRHGTLISLPQDPETNQVFDETAAALELRRVTAEPYLPPTIDSTHLYQDFSVSNLNLGAPGPDSRTWETRTPIETPVNGATITYTVQALGAPVEVDSPLTGAHQQRNIALAIAAAVELAQSFPITPATIAQGIRQTRWPGRLERIQASGIEWILDVAHNPAGAWALRSGLCGLLNDQRPRSLIFSCLRDKPINEMARILFPLFDQVIFAPIHSARAADLEDLEAAGKATGTLALSAASVRQALQWAAERGAGLVVISGSVYLVGEARSLLLAHGADLEGILS